MSFVFKIYTTLLLLKPPLRSPPATNSSGGVLKILAHGPICVGGVSKILRNSPIWPRGVSKFLEQTYPKCIKNTVFQGKNSQNFPRASRARSPKIPKFSQFAWRGFKNFRLRRNLRWRGFKNSGPRTYWWWRGLQRGGGLIAIAWYVFYNWVMEVTISPWSVFSDTFCTSREFLIKPRLLLISGIPRH